MTATILSITTFPNIKSKEVGQAFLKYWKEVPAWIKGVGKTPYLRATINDGIRSYALYEVEDSKLAEAQRALIDYHTKMSLDIDGYRYELRPVLSAEEALPIVGLAPPKPRK
jgi:hypothetical protein